MIKMSINQLVKAAHENAVNKGWWEEDRGFGELIALMHSELSEALEFYRDGHPINELLWTGTSGLKPDGVPAELADVVIRIFDACGRHGIDLEAAITAKMAYNATRPHRHGGKKI
jgi:NTP pyrophosphatase (non-canonical NTP hydrolase)